MALPLSYNVRNLRVRWRVTLLAVFGIALVVAVLMVLLAMSEGFATALRATGRRDNAIIVQRGSASELSSAVALEHRNLISVDERVARGGDGQPLASPEHVIVIALPKATDGQPTNVSIRAVTPRAFEVRGGIEITAGRSFTPGLDEVIVGEGLVRRIRGMELGQVVRYQRKQFRIVGIFASQGGAFESEIWGDFDTFGAMFQRAGECNALVVRMKDKGDIKALDSFIRSQPRVQLQAVEERKYYEDQAGPLADALGGLATFVTVIMGIGAVFGAMNTMYAIVAARTREVGTLRALGFSRSAILLAFVMESVFLALVGGAVGTLLALPMNGFSTGTGQTQSFSEIAFAFRITGSIVLAGFAAALVMGLVGGLLPSLRAARLPISSALREA
jgi:ABC-type lipoprotein release transport system permease subunit